MTKEEITSGVKQVIAINSRYAINEINPNDHLDKFISSQAKDYLAAELRRQFTALTGAEQTELANDLYSSIKTVDDLIKRINTYLP